MHKSEKCVSSPPKKQLEKVAKAKLERICKNVLLSIDDACIWTAHVNL